MRKLVTISLLLVFLSAGLFVVLLSASIYTYHVLTAETVIAELRFDAIGDRQYLARVRTGDRCAERVLPVFGDQWRVDAQFLKWKYWALLFGLDSQYRLDRLEGRYRSTAEQNTNVNVAHDLGDGTAFDVVDLAGALGSWTFLIDATYGSSTYQDIDVGSAYSVYRTTTGIITRAVPVPPLPSAGEPLPIEVNRACGAAPPVWERIAAWTDDRVVSVLDVFAR
jgi:hypothetical protein